MLLRPATWRGRLVSQANEEGVDGVGKKGRLFYMKIKHGCKDRRLLTSPKGMGPTLDVLVLPM